MTAGGGTQGFVVVVTGTDSDEDEEDDDVCNIFFFLEGFSS